VNESSPVLRARHPVGRPRKDGHVPGTSPAQELDNTGAPSGAVVPSTIAPRLLDREGTASYLSVSVWTVRDLEAAGILHRVRVPMPNGEKLKELQKALYDRQELDALVESWRDGGQRP
jgi:hypothetical protein